MGTLGGGSFSAREVAFLQSLPAVERVSQKRIEYADDFKHYVMRRYMAGDSPVAIFRACGLDSSLIGYKRIERCIARWKQTVDLDALARTPLDTIESETQRFEVSAAHIRALHDPGARYGISGRARLELPHIHSVPVTDSADSDNIFEYDPDSTYAIHSDAGFESSGITCEQCEQFIIRQLRRLEQLEYDVQQLKHHMHTDKEPVSE